MSDNVTTDILIMDEDLRSRFDSIYFAEKLIGEFKIQRYMYTAEDDVGEYVRLQLTDWVIKVNLPTFGWIMKLGEKLIHLFIECNSDDDYTIKYPIRSYIVEPRDYNQANILQQELDKEDTIKFLDMILHEL